VPVTTRAERRRRGRELRKDCPRSSQGQWNARDDAIDLVDFIEVSNGDRIPGLIPLRYARMAQSPFAFFRGTAAIQAQDLGASPNTGIVVQLCGDCHLMNFGGFATAERNLVFDINDFDETFPGPWEWDVKRLAASFVLAARDRSFSDAIARDVVLEGMSEYRSRLAEYAAMSPLEVWYTQIAFAQLRAFLHRQARAVAGLRQAEATARRRTSETLLPKIATIENGRVRIVDNPPLIYHFGDVADLWSQALRAFFQQYRHSIPEERAHLFDRYDLEDIAVKVVGVGSVGTRCIVALFIADMTDPLLLQAKEARRSVLESGNVPSRYAHQGIRVVYGQRLMQAASDIFLGWATVSDRDFYVRQLRDMKISADIESFRPLDLANYAKMCGWALARAHAKAGDAATLTGYLGTGDVFDHAMAQYAAAYADQVERDYAAFERAIRSGRIDTGTGDFTETDFAP
jgi:uncharacterized protein (DUF2252 family)